MANRGKLSECEKGYRRWVSPKPTRKGKAMGYVCPTCGEQIYDNQPTAHTDDGLAHAKCAAP